MADRSEFLRVGTDAELRDCSVRSHLPDGRVVAWTGGAGRTPEVAIDAELDVAPPVALTTRFGADDFWTRWTQLEVVAKLTDVPVVRLLPRLTADRVVPDGIDVSTYRFADVVVSVGHPRGTLVP